VTGDEIAQHAPLLSYIDPVATRPDSDGETVAVSPWPAFPRAVLRRGPWAEFPPHPEDRDGNYRAAEHLGDEDYRPGVFVDRDDNVLHLPVPIVNLIRWRGMANRAMLTPNVRRLQIDLVAADRGVPIKGGS
jgi:hypothetical protein